jgi:hypothetical protein
MRRNLLAMSVAALILAGCGSDPGTESTAGTSEPPISTAGLPGQVVSLLGDQSQDVVKWGCNEEVHPGSKRTTKCIVHVGDPGTVRKFDHKIGGWVEE